MFSPRYDTVEPFHWERWHATMKKLTAVLLALCLTIPSLPVRAAEPPAWAAEACQVLRERSILPFVSSGSISRGEFVEMLVNTLDQAIPHAKLEPFSPVGWDYFCDYAPTVIQRAAGFGLLEGTVGADGLRYFNYEDPLTREQGAKLVCSLLDLVSQTLDYPLEPSLSPAVYADEAAISPWALSYARKIAAYGLMKGDDGGNFDPSGELDYPSSAVLVYRLLELLDTAVAQGFDALLLQARTDWSGASRFGAHDYSASRSLTGWSSGYYTIDNGDGTVSGLVVGSEEITIERFSADGSLTASQTLEKELPTFGAFLDSGRHFYLAFGQDNDEEDDDREVWRIVQYDRDWNRLSAASVSGGASYTTVPFRAAVARMAVSEDGKTLALHAARQRYTTPDDGLRHQSNLTVTMNTADMKVLSVSEEFPSNHVSHSFGQFVRFDGEQLVTVDHGDAYPRAFILQSDSQAAELLPIAGGIGENVTNAIGSGLELSGDGYLFLGCSTPQVDLNAEADTPWSLFLTYTSKEAGKPTPPWPEGSTKTSLTLLPGGRQYKASWTDPDGRTNHWGTFNVEEDLSATTLTWLTHGESTVNCARLVKLDESTFAAMWQEGADIHCLVLDGKGQPTGQERILENTPMPPTDPVVMDGSICWIQHSSLPQSGGKPALYRLALEEKDI